MSNAWLPAALAVFIATGCTSFTSAPTDAASRTAATGSAGAKAIPVADIGSFHIGGRTATLSGLPEREIVLVPGAPPFRIDPNGDFQVDQMYVQYVLHAQPRARYPLLFWHGGGLTGATWETKPDGQPGWQRYFLGAGYSVYISDAVERGRASWARYPDIYRSEPVFRSMGEAWELARIGAAGTFASDPAQRRAYVGTQFPVAAFDQFAKQFVPRWATNDAAAQAAYEQLVQKVCPCVIVAHSHGASFAFRAAAKMPDRIKAIVAIEPIRAPASAQVNADALRGVPHLFVWGDFIDAQPVWRRLRTGIERYQATLKQAGVPVDTLDLPQRDIVGNSHMIMMDRNSDQVAALIDEWLARQGVRR